MNRFVLIRNKKKFNDKKFKTKKIWNSSENNKPGLQMDTIQINLFRIIYRFFFFVSNVNSKGFVKLKKKYRKYSEKSSDSVDSHVTITSFEVPCVFNQWLVFRIIFIKSALGGWCLIKNMESIIWFLQNRIDL